MNNLRPLTYLNIFNKIFTNAWKVVEHLLIGKGRDIPDWPEWCFLPTEAWLAIYEICQSIDKKLTVPSTGSLSMLATIGTWRYTQSIYRYDATFRAELDETQFNAHLPVDVLLRIPQYCFYIETPGMNWQDNIMHGYWVRLEWNTDLLTTELHLLLDLDSSPQPFIIQIGDWTLEEAVKKSFQALEQARKGSGKPQLPQITQFAPEFAKSIAPLLSMILYLCTEKPEIDDSRVPGTSPTRGIEMVKTKRGLRLFPPDRVRIWDVGTQIGIKLRTAKSLDKNGKHGVHIRRGHWHLYWTGPRNGKRGYVFHWIHITLVGMADNYHGGNMPSTRPDKRGKLKNG